MIHDYDYIIKVVIIGDSGVGKSSIITKYVDNEYSECFISTIGVDFRIKSVTYKEKSVKLQIWDTAGQERFAGITKTYYRGANGVILCFDLSNYESFLNTITKWYTIASSIENVDIYLVGAKSDLPREVTDKEIKEFANEKNIIYCETCAKNGHNIQKMFDKIIEGIIKNNKVENNKNKIEYNHNISLVTEQKTTQCCIST